MLSSLYPLSVLAYFEIDTQPRTAFVDMTNWPRLKPPNNARVQARCGAQRSNVACNPVLAGMLEKHSGCAFDPISYGFEESFGFFDIG
jgi:hypothetical protein